MCMVLKSEFGEGDLGNGLLLCSLRDEETRLSLVREVIGSLSVAENEEDGRGDEERILPVWPR